MKERVLNHMQTTGVKIATLFAVSVLALSASTAFAQVVACTADAMQCPDGSYVGRSGPNCQFVCPTPAPSCSVLTRSIYYGTTDASTGGQVTQLQAFLAARGYLSSSSVITFLP